jgi:2-C-methyl-D-erythritol 4-phosphate cytidylyltransferase/2-C-methyl-D-erythritol 2,4-cyclodiphosphate synthase
VQVPTAALIVAAGRGTRAATTPEAVPKQYQPLAGVAVLARTVAAFAAEPRVETIQVVIHADDVQMYERAMCSLQQRCRAPVIGGATRQASVLAGLEALRCSDIDRVLIHDAARPLVSGAEIARIIDGLADSPAVIAAVPVTDTLKRLAGGSLETLDRSGVWAAQTPQGFHFQAILDAHRQARAAGRDDFTDDAAIAEWAGIKVAIAEGSRHNMKLTTSADFTTAEATLAGRRPISGPPDVRTGTGFDVHRFAAGDAVWLCGVRIAHTHRLEGHSDADVGLHALTDAILGAIADGDIGQHFPPSDPQWKGAPSHQFLRDAARRAAARGARITNVDVTLLCEAPRIASHRDAMRQAIADIIGIGIERVGVKATTTEGLGFIGREEGIAAMATATVVVDQ